MRGKAWPLRRVKQESLAPSSRSRPRRDQARAHAQPWRSHRESAVDACWRAMEVREFAGVEGTFIHPSTIRFRRRQCNPRRRDPRRSSRCENGHRCHRKRRTDLRHRQRHPSARAESPHPRAEPETAAPGALSFEKDSPQVFSEWQASFVDGAGGKSIFPRMWERMQGIVDGSIVVSLDEVRRAMRLVAEKTRVIAEGAGALAVAAALSGRAGRGRSWRWCRAEILNLKKFAELVL